MRIAVVGSGIAGLATAWLLCEQHQVTLFEANDYAGGHTHTVDVRLQGRHCGVDTGFLVFNEVTYPNLVPMLRHLDVPVAQSEMTFSLALEAPAIEWSGSNLDTLFAQRRNLLRPAFLQRFPAGVELVREGDTADFLHVMVEGQVEVFSAYHDRETTVAVPLPFDLLIFCACSSRNSS